MNNEEAAAASFLLVKACCFLLRKFRVGLTYGLGPDITYKLKI
jgi:hypothetical protein